MKKCEIVKKNTDFNDIINTGKFLKNKFYNVYYKETCDKRFPKFGLAVSKKCGNAVKRNKIKRRLRMIVSNNKELFYDCNNYIIMVRKGIVDISYKEMEDSLVGLLKERKLK